jgi:hypothetical protein
MRSGMSGGGTEGQAQIAQRAARTPQPLTQEDTQGGVTVSATLLTPDKPRPDGTLAVQVKLDTHAVDLAPTPWRSWLCSATAKARRCPRAGLKHRWQRASSRGYAELSGHRCQWKAALEP